MPDIFQTGVTAVTEQGGESGSWKPVRYTVIYTTPTHTQHTTSVIFKIMIILSY